MKQITKQEIEAVLNTVYQTNISAQQFDALKQFFAKLPDISPKKEIEEKTLA